MKTRIDIVELSSSDNDSGGEESVDSIILKGLYYTKDIIRVLEKGLLKLEMRLSDGNKDSAKLLRKLLRLLTITGNNVKALSDELDDHTSNYSLTKSSKSIKLDKLSVSGTKPSPRLPSRRGANKTPAREAVRSKPVSHEGSTRRPLRAMTTIESTDFIDESKDNELAGMMTTAIETLNNLSSDEDSSQHVTKFKPSPPIKNCEIRVKRLNKESEVEIVKKEFDTDNVAISNGSEDITFNSRGRRSSTRAISKESSQRGAEVITGDIEEETLPIARKRLSRKSNIKATPQTKKPKTSKKKTARKSSVSNTRRKKGTEKKTSEVTEGVASQGIKRPLRSRNRQSVKYNDTSESEDDVEKTPRKRSNIEQVSVEDDENLNEPQDDETITPNEVEKEEVETPNKEEIVVDESECNGKEDVETDENGDLKSDKEILHAEEDNSPIEEKIIECDKAQSGHDENSNQEESSQDSCSNNDEIVNETPHDSGSVGNSVDTTPKKEKKKKYKTSTNALSFDFENPEASDDGSENESVSSKNNEASNDNEKEDTFDT